MALSVPSRALALALVLPLALPACAVSTTAPEPTGKTAEQRAAEEQEAARQAAARQAQAEKFAPVSAGVSPEGRPLVYSPAQVAARRYDFEGAVADMEAGGRALQDGDAAEARAKFQAAIDQWPLLKAAWQGLAEAAEREGDQETAQRARFFAARMDWVGEVHPLTAAHAFRNLSEGRTTEPETSTPAYRESAAQLVSFLEAADIANVEAANRAQPGEDFIQRYGIYVAGAAGLALAVARINDVFFGGNDSGSD